jgi:hypothetical protein
MLLLMLAKTKLSMNVGRLITRLQNIISANNDGVRMFGLPRVMTSLYDHCCAENDVVRLKCIYNQRHY